MDQMLDRVAGLDVHKKTVTVCVRDCRLQRPATPVLQALGDPGREAPPDGRPRDARGVPGREPQAGGSSKPGIESEVAKKIGARTAFGGTSESQETRFESSKGLGFGAAAGPASEAAK